MDNTINRVSALFATEWQSTSLIITANDDGTYEVKGFYRRLGESGFPTREQVDREGRVYLGDVEVLMDTVLSFCKRGWYHHYLGEKSFFAREEVWWNLRIEYADGRIERWEGINAAPKTIDDVFDALVAFGMPSMRLSLNGTFGGSCASWRKEPGLDRIVGYVPLLAEACTRVHCEDPDEDAMLVIDEFHDDVLQYLHENRPEVLSRSALEVWGVTSDIAGICKENVDSAPRQKMLVLYAALLQHDDYRKRVVRALDDGVLHRWANRLKVIPDEELKEKGRRLEEERQMMKRSIDSAICERIEAGKVFTSYDIAKQTGSSAHSASARIRNYVREGKLVALPGDYPRQYKAAASKVEDDQAVESEVADGQAAESEVADGQAA